LKLTYEQKLIVESNHSLIYGFAHKYNVNIPEYYGLLAQTLCEAVLAWDENLGSLTTIFYTMALNNLINEKRNLKHQCRSANINTVQIIEDIPDEDGDISKYGHIPVSFESGFDEISEIEWLSQKYNCDARLVELLIDGRTQTEIANELNVSQSTISEAIKKIRTNYKERETK